MSAWVYLVSQFSQEALLFEALLIFGLIFIYAAFWLLSKRRYGAVKSEVPSGVVKEHLNELIHDAEKLRAQLFGILYQGTDAPHSTGHSTVTPGEPSLHAAGATAAATATDPQLGQRISELEAKIQEQLSVISKVETEKTTLATEIEKLKTTKPGEGPAAGNPVEVDGLKAKLKEMEDRLEEYSIIEDDLANLKRLQQENAALKKQIGGGAAEPAAASIEPAKPETAKVDPAKEPVKEAAKAEAPKAEPAKEAAPVEAPKPKIEAASVAAAEVPKADAPKGPAPTEAQLGALASDVEKSIAAAKPEGSKPETDDLLKEFEKMLNS